ncbi:MAG TPA: BTAD domain-containing putative transcriptional regulator, partial [Longimicrobiales bacterium]
DARWAEALELYGGGFLQGSHLASTHGFEEWVDARRAQATRLHRRARRELVRERLAGNDLAGALVVAQRWAELEPLDDEAQQRTVELLARVGRRTEALEHYQRFRERLKGEELEPMPELEQLASDVASGRLQPEATTGAPAAPPIPAGDDVAAAPSSPAAPETSVTGQVAAPAGAAPSARRATRDLVTGGIAGLMLGAPCALLAALAVRAFLPPLSPVAVGVFALALGLILLFALVIASLLVWRRLRPGMAGGGSARPVRLGAGLGFALGFLVALTGAFALAPAGVRGTGAARLGTVKRMERGRVAIMRFANRSGDAALEPIGRMAEEWIAQKLRSIPEAELVGPAPAPASDTSADAVARLASAHDAQVVLLGSYYREGTDVLFVARLVPGPGGNVPEEVAAMPIGPVRVSVARPTAGVERLAAVVAGAIASGCIGPECAPGRRPPTYEARLAWLEAQVALFERGDQEDAIGQFRRAITLDSTFVNAYTGLASQFMFQGLCLPVDSIGDILESRRQDFAEYDRLYMRSMRATCHSDFDGAYHHRLEALRIAPDAWGARWGVAEAAVASGRLQEAERRMRELSTSRAAAQANYYNLFTYVLHVQGRFADELQLAEEGRRRLPDAAGRYQMGLRGLAALGRTPEIEARLAEARLGSARRLDLPAVYGQLAAELEWHGYRAQARQYALRALDEMDRVAPAERASPGYRVQRALTLLQLERWQEARRQLEGTTVTEAWRRQSGTALSQAQV